MTSMPYGSVSDRESTCGVIVNDSEGVSVIG